MGRPLVPQVPLGARRAWALVASLALHVFITLALAPGSHREADPAAVSPAGGAAMPAAGRGVVIDAPPMSEVALEQTDAPPTPEGVVVQPTAGDAVPRPDTATSGHGGTASVSAAAVNLADVDDRMRLSPDLVSRLDRDQLQRLRVARERVTWEDRRATTHPAELTFVTTGPGIVRERRRAAEVDPSRGALASPRAGELGGLLGGDRTIDPFDDDEARPGVAARGGSEPAPGLGLPTSGAGPDHRAVARLGDARPSVTQGPVSVPARGRGRPKDDVDSEQAVATTIRSLVHASTAGGAVDDGPGGSGGGGESGSGGPRGAGSTGRPLGEGEGDVYDYWTKDPRLVAYFRALHARIDPLWAHAFPKSAVVDLKQGTVIMEFTVFADGRIAVAWPPVRPSGIDEFDRNVAAAIRSASPFAPIPRELGVDALRIRAAFEAKNPMVN